LIRLIYWFLVLVETLLVLAALLLFIVTDSRAIKYIAQTSLDTSGLTYESIEGNLFNGLEVKKLSYEKKLLFSSALIHWNPLTLFYDKITIHKLDAKGIELENIMAMVQGMKSEESEGKIGLDFEIVIKSTYFEINPYVFEGVKFSSFVFETAEIALNKDLVVNTNSLYLKFDSDIVNVALDAKIEDNRLIIDKLDLKDISANDITKLTRKVKAKYKDKKENNKKVFFKDIKVKHIMGTMKAVQYGDLKIKGATLHLYEGIIEPSNNFNYQVKKVDFKGRTNFGKLDYKGYIKDSNIHAKGDIILDKKLFKKYALPLNFEALKKLPSSLRLNHYGVWIDIDTQVKKLLKLKSDFNLDIHKSKHKLHYDYSDVLFTIESDVTGAMTYAKQFKLQNRVRVDKKGFSYEGEVQILKPNNLPTIVSEYLLADLNASYKANASSFKMLLESQLLRGHLSMPKYKSAKVSLKSKTSNIKLNKFIADLPVAFQNETMSLESTSSFDFKNLKKSKIELKAQSNTLLVNANMNLEKPFEIHFVTKITNNATLKKIIPNLNFNQFKELKGSVKFTNNLYQINVGNQAVKLFMNYNGTQKIIENGVLNVGKQEFSFNSDKSKSLILQTSISNIQKIFDEIERYYYIKLPDIKGKVNLRFEKQENGTILVHFESPSLQYISTGSVDLSVTNIYNIDTTFKIDKDFNIEIKNYQFKLEDNGYLNVFYSNQTTYLKLDNQNLIIKKFQINDKIEVTGNYNVETLKGNLKVDANRYDLSTKDFALVLDLDLRVKLDREKFNIEGNVDILGDTITYEVVGTDIVEDADIIILDDMIRAKESAFNNFKLYLKIRSKKVLKYIAENINIEFLNELSILKNYDQKMLVTGVTTITNGYYQIEDKQFMLDESHLYFTGDVKTPLLDIKANYVKDEYNVHIFISGTTDAPIVNFNSEPFLTQQEILSLILFDGTGSSSGKGAEAYTLLGGTFAKGLIKV